ncbi:MAG: hypothetical protein R3C26_25065 [Calditrichia bacterium]
MKFVVERSNDHTQRIGIFEHLQKLRIKAFVAAAIALHSANLDVFDGRVDLFLGLKMAVNSFSRVSGTRTTPRCISILPPPNAACKILTGDGRKRVVFPDTGNPTMPTSIAGGSPSALGFIYSREI